ncbi:C4-dicarboxylate ABC transporter [Salipaludibacillus neizhouensis]|uniref:C4-dicarboxylate ABC transporter n=1 Tax=Salipaludibacillus neizhouensis TaxID=885475 RepID=A0A3A9JX54_9BACI|nr:TRAP transporter large permease [Salipaludibacillus neizhouensis]RKL65057.1 C4-dicarboxylate ABC transporter [Salipaludibacillus neizhouensis]
MTLLLMFGTLLILLILRMPVAFAIGVSSIVTLLVTTDITLSLIIPRMLNTLNSFTFLAIPFFMLAGSIMEHGGISTRLVRFANSLLGHIKGGLGHATIFTSTIFAGISGSASADTSAVGSVMIPSMVKRGYPKGYAAALTACAGAIGPIIPPSIIMIIYGSLTGLSISKLFLAGAIPGIVMAIGLIIINYLGAIKYNLPYEKRASFKVVWNSFINAFWALLAPVIIIGGILLGLFTATEASVVAVIYSLVISMFIYKELSFKDLYKVLVQATHTSIMVLFIAATASIFGWILANEKLPLKISVWLNEFTTNPYIIMLLVVIILLIIGCVIETIAASIIFIPVLAVIAEASGFDPFHFATVVAICLIVGGVTPPVGVLLFITNSIAEARFKDTLRYLIPFFTLILVVILLVAYIPTLSTFLPGLLE